MNEVIDAIRMRRTVKKMDPARAPPRAELEAIMEAASWAPNHHMTEPWRFVVLEKDARRRLGVVLADALGGASAGPVPDERLEKERDKPLSTPVVIALIGSPGRGRTSSPRRTSSRRGRRCRTCSLRPTRWGWRRR